MNEATRSLRAGYRVGLLALALTAILGSAACANPLSRTSAKDNVHACSDLVLKEMVTNQSQKGVWNCLSADLQNKLHSYGVDGDGVFTSPGGGAPPVLSQHYVGRSNGVDVYVLMFQPNNGAKQAIVVSFWTDAQNKVTNLDVSYGLF